MPNSISQSPKKYVKLDVNHVSYTAHRYGKGITRLSPLPIGDRDWYKKVSRSDEKKHLWTESKLSRFYSDMHRSTCDFKMFITFRWGAECPEAIEEYMRKIRLKFGRLSSKHKGCHSGFIEGSQYIDAHYHVCVDYELTEKEQNELSSLFEACEVVSYDFKPVDSQKNCRLYSCKRKKNGVHPCKLVKLKNGWNGKQIPATFCNRRFKQSLLIKPIKSPKLSGVKAIFRVIYSYFVKSKSNGRTFNSKSRKKKLVRPPVRQCVSEFGEIIDPPWKDFIIPPPQRC